MSHSPDGIVPSCPQLAPKGHQLSPLSWAAELLAACQTLLQSYNFISRLPSLDSPNYKKSIFRLTPVLTDSYCFQFFLALFIVQAQY